MLLEVRYPIEVKRKKTIKFKSRSARRLIRLFIDSLPVVETREQRRLRWNRKSLDSKKTYKNASIQSLKNKHLQISMTMRQTLKNRSPEEKKQIGILRSKTRLRNAKYYAEQGLKIDRLNRISQKRKKLCLYEENVKRKNTYCGVITEQELNNL